MNLFLQQISRSLFRVAVFFVLIILPLSTVKALTPFSAPESKAKNNFISVSLGQPFTLKKAQVAKMADTGLEVEVKAFYNNPCPEGRQCMWSGIGIDFEYRLNGQVQKGLDLVQAFGYKITLLKSDYETYANLKLEKIN